MSEVIVAPKVRELETLGQQLAGWLGHRLPDANGIRIDNLAYPRGAGQSHETILFDAHMMQDGKERTHGYVVRIKPTSHTVYPDDMFDQQYELMRVLSARDDVPVARPLWKEDDPALLGAPFFVMEKKTGRVPVSVPPYAQYGWVAEATPAQRARMWEDGVRNLATIQRTPLAELGFLQGEAPEAAAGLAQEWDKFVRFAAWVQQDRPLKVLDTALERLEARWPANRPEGLVWGDARIGNMMFDDDFKVVAVMDWEQPSLGGALNDLGWWIYNAGIMHGERPGRPHLAGMGTREDTIALWRDVTGIPTADIEWYEDFTAFKYACLGARCGMIGMHPPRNEEQIAEQLGIVLER